ELAERVLPGRLDHGDRAVEAVSRTLTRPQHEPRFHESSRSERSERSGRSERCAATVPFSSRAEPPAEPYVFLNVQVARTAPAPAGESYRAAGLDRADRRGRGRGDAAADRRPPLAAAVAPRRTRMP